MAYVGMRQKGKGKFMKKYTEEKIKREDVRLYIFDHDLCGTPREMRTYIVTESGNTIKFCAHCLRLRQRIKKCISCGNDFKPSCAATHTCKHCYNSNKYKEEQIQGGY